VDAFPSSDGSDGEPNLLSLIIHKDYDFLTDTQELFLHLYHFHLQSEAAPVCEAFHSFQANTANKTNISHVY
jgi:hypothetical protein